jgi:hypothetical protein
MVEAGMIDRESERVLVKLYPHGLSGRSGLETSFSLWEVNRKRMAVCAHDPHVEFDSETTNFSIISTNNGYQQV